MFADVAGIALHPENQAVLDCMTAISASKRTPETEWIPNALVYPPQYDNNEDCLPDLRSFSCISQALHSRKKRNLTQNRRHGCCDTNFSRVKFCDTILANPPR